MAQHLEQRHLLVSADWDLLIAGLAPARMQQMAMEADCSAHFFFCSSFRTARVLGFPLFAKTLPAVPVSSQSQALKDASRRCTANSSISFLLIFCDPKFLQPRESQKRP